MSRRLRVIAVISVGIVAAGGTAWAHPFGPPPTARLTAQGPSLAVTWSATPDDAVAIGEELGVMPPGSIDAYRVEGSTQVAPSSADEARLSASSELRDYLLEHIAVRQDGNVCRGEVTEVEDFVHTGATVTLTCPDTVDDVTVRITMLHALHPAYRTVAIAANGHPGETVFTVDNPEQQWRFGDSASSGRSPALPLGIAALALGLLGAVLLWHRSTRRP